MHVRSPALLITLLAACAVAPALAQQRSPDAAQCRQMVEAMVHTVKSTPVERPPEKARQRALVEQLDQLVRDHRARRVDACDTWAAISRMMTRQ